MLRGGLLDRDYIVLCSRAQNTQTVDTCIGKLHLAFGVLTKATLKTL